MYVSYTFDPDVGGGHYRKHQEEEDEEESLHVVGRHALHTEQDGAQETPL